jgi:integrase
MDINLLCSSLIDALRKEGYNESTIFNYQGVVRRFKAFCEAKGVLKYSSEIGKMYADDVVSCITGKFSRQRYISQGRFFRLIDSYYNTGEFDFSYMPRGRVHPSNEYYHRIYEKFCSDLKDEYDNENTRHFYEYGMYSFLHYLENKGTFLQLEELTPVILIEYLTQSKPSRQRGVLCELRKICCYLGRGDLLIALAGIHAVRHNRIIPVLDHKEQEQIKAITSDKTVPLRDTAMILLGLSTGIRACDIIRLRLSDVDWMNDTITWKQSKTGNLVCLPLIPSVGNAIARYIVEQRPPAPNDYLFVRMLAPFDPLSCHSSCYVMVKRVLEKAGISKNGRIWGMHLLRHNAASTMVENEVAIETIAAILGHTDADTTGIYITTDEKRLKECVLPFGKISKEVHA